MKYNFFAGPAILPKEVMEEAAKSAIEFGGMGLSILEISHRSKQFIAVMDEAVSLVRELLNVGDDFEVMFLSGGASTQFGMLPMNLLGEGDRAAYTDTGAWAAKAIKDAKLYGNIDVLCSSKAENYNHIPKGYEINGDYRYLHVTSNNTIYGTQYQEFPETNVPLVSDMSSDIFSRWFDINKFDAVYAGAQKNMGPAGTTLVILRKSALGRATRAIPAMMNYQNHIENGSMYNTPPVFPVYVSMLTLRWLKKFGGILAIQKHNETKAGLLYDEIERNPLFYSPTAKEDRSKMNVCFLLHNTENEKLFLDKCKEAGCVGLEGHRSVGGFRASIYNAMSIEGVQVLVDLMKDFEKNHG